MASNRSASQQPEFLPAVRRGRLEQLTIYEISDSELDILEKGSPESLYLSFAIFLLSVATSFTATLLTTTTKSQATFTIFVVLVVTGYLGSVFLLLLWARNRSAVSKCARTIRDRLPPEGIPEQIPAPPDAKA